MPPTKSLLTRVGIVIVRCKSFTLPPHTVRSHSRLSMHGSASRYCIPDLLWSGNHGVFTCSRNAQRVLSGSLEGGGSGQVVPAATSVIRRTPSAPAEIGVRLRHTPPALLFPVHRRACATESCPGHYKVSKLFISETALQKGRAAVAIWGRSMLISQRNALRRTLSTLSKSQPLMGLWANER